MKPATKDAYQLLHDGAVELGYIEAHGIRIDEAQLDLTTAKLGSQISDMEEELKAHKTFRIWQRHFGLKTKLGSREQLATILFDKLGYTCTRRTAPTARFPLGRAKADEAAIEATGDEFAKRFIKMEKLKKLRNTYLAGIKRELMNDYIHPSFDLHLAKTYRSTSSGINFQNLPIRNPEYSRTIRELFLPDNDDHHLVEIDYSGIEVRVAACYNNDPVLIDYILHSPPKDMHRDMAMQCYLLSRKDWDKLSEKDARLLRYFGKNKFVFPNFYGSYYVDCAKALWQALGESNLGHIITHLKSKSIKGLGKCEPNGEPRKGNFDHHIREVEQDFWERRFRVYNKWRHSWYDAYLRTGSFKTLTGFYFEGVLKRNDVINYPVQGSAFHCLLQSLIWLNQWLRRKQMLSRIVGQIHDSIVGSVHKKELQAYINKVVQLMTVRLPKEWQWLNIPLTVEVDVAPVGKSWADKQEWTCVAGIWQPKKKVQV